jgi:sterol 3beta-glucosyltransferase
MPQELAHTVVEVNNTAPNDRIAHKPFSAGAYNSCPRILDRYTRIVILTAGTRGDVQPFLALGLGLKEAGFQVSVAAFSNFEEFITSQGLDFRPINVNIREIAENETGYRVIESSPKPLRNLIELICLIKPIFGQIQCGFWDASQGADVIIGTLPLLGYDIAENLQVPYFEASIFPRLTKAFPEPFWPFHVRLGRGYNLLTHLVMEQVRWQPFRRQINRWRQQTLQLLPYPFLGPFSQQRKRRVLVLYGFSPTVVPKPADWGDWVHITGYWFLKLPQGWQPPQKLVDFLESGPPPVYVGFGSMNNRNSNEMTDLLIKALALSGKRGILATGWGGLSKADLPNGVLMIESVPHDWLFPRMAAVVCHAGAGTIAAGLRAGVPLISVPVFGDQPFWARRAYKLGVGLRPVPRVKLTSERLAATICTTVNDESIRSRAAGIRQQILAENGVRNAVTVILSHLEYLHNRGVSY